MSDNAIYRRDFLEKLGKVSLGACVAGGLSLRAVESKLRGRGNLSPNARCALESLVMAYVVLVQLLASRITQMSMSLRSVI